MSKFIYIFITLLVSGNEAAKILAYFPIPSISHQVVFRPLIQELARRGHEVITVTTDPAFPKGKAPANLTEIDIHDMSYDLWVKSFRSTKPSYGNIRDWIKQSYAMMDMFMLLFEAQMEVKEVKDAIFDKSKKYDLVIVEACVYSALGISHVIDAPVIQISSFGPQLFNTVTVGSPVHIFRQPLPIQQRINPESLWEKINELFIYYELETVYDKIEGKFNQLTKRIFGPDTPDLNELKNNVDMLFLNVHPLWELNRPTPPNVIYMGGVHQTNPKELPHDIKSYLDASQNGVIYVSFGTNIDPTLLPADRIQTLVNAFSKLPYNILWKWNKDELPGRSANIRISKWLPQSDLLRHPKIKLFVTQAGLQSTDEAISAGVPVVGIPMLGDQWYNAELYVYHKIGLKVDLATATEEILLNAINTVINDDSYRKNMVELRSIMQDQVQSPLERAVWWTEYVLRHGGAKHLRSPLANLSWAEYLEIDLVLVLVVAMISAILLSLFIIYKIYNLVRCAFCNKSKLKRN